MNKFTKTMIASAVMGLSLTGVVEASIATGSNTASEVLLSVYDGSRQLTFTYDLGLTMGMLLGNTTTSFDNALSKSYDLAQLTANAFTLTPTGGIATDARWSTFATGLNPAATKYGLVVAGTAGRLLATGPSVSPAKFATTTVANGSVTGITNHMNAVSQGALPDNPGAGLGQPAANLSSIVADGDTANTGQHNQLNPFTTLFGTKSDALADILYGQSGNFYYYNQGTSVLKASQLWTLSGGMLTYGAPVAPVPLPAAVWLFGAGLMGVLRLNRRKRAAL